MFLEDRMERVQELPLGFEFGLRDGLQRRRQSDGIALGIDRNRWITETLYQVSIGHRIRYLRSVQPIREDRDAEFDRVRTTRI